MEPLDVTIAEAARLSGVSKATVRNRIDRGSLPARLEGGQRYVSLAELRRQGLLSERRSGDLAARLRLTADLLDREDAYEPGTLVDALLARLERQAEQIGQLRVAARRQR